MQQLADQQNNDCFVPGCKKEREGEDCCAEHSEVRFAPNSPLAIPNDGVVDELAIELAVTGVRPVRLTWIERDIATAILLANGVEEDEVCKQLGQNLLKTDSRRERICKIADAIRRERRLRAA